MTKTDNEASLKLRCPYCGHMFMFKYNKETTQRAVVVCPYCEKRVELPKLNK